MESSGPRGNTSEPPTHKWSEIIGTTIAVITLTLPLLVIGYYPANSNLDPLQTNSTYFQPKVQP